ncbi:glycoside hydrolase [Aureobasidium namibiae CBS 147.97]|uniref:Glycoside hydrolase n=1 Tax=Aureobasidium namibiae CBS 147.97 TaxID=1043004 RepID=A0A074W530_9PEZI|nr:glycoside hydrolase [Aureobasidium namibiae CBS 147.97]KEQ68235.1 glycoside hydrolase [Aureobasidium namibiae CBS 147.97]
MFMEASTEHMGSCGVYDPGNPLSDENVFRKDVIETSKDFNCLIPRHPGGKSWCQVVGREPYFALNFGTGTLDEALDWLEYCNPDKNAYPANLNRKLGHDKPYNVGWVYMSIINERL